MAYKRNQKMKLASVLVMRLLHSIFHPVFLMFVFFVAMGNVAKSQTISLTAGTASCENYNTLASSGTSSTLPSGWYFVETGTNANVTPITADHGANTGGDTYSYGAKGSTERALVGLWKENKCIATQTLLMQ